MMRMAKMKIKRLFIYILCMLISMMAFSVTAHAATYFEVTGGRFPVEMYKNDLYVAKGKVTSKYNISSITIGICDSEGNLMTGHSVTKKPDAKTYDLGKIKKTLYTNTLSTGTYYYKVYVKDVKSHSKTLVKEQFKVVKAFTYTDLKYPEVVVTGTDKPVSGMINSAYTMKTIDLGIADSTGKTWVKYRTYTPGTKYFDISSADAKLDFSTLEPGKYYFKMIVTDSRGCTSTLKRAVEVKDAFAVSKLAYADKMVKAEDPDFSGKITSVYNMTKVKVGVYNETSKKWLNYVILNPNAKSASLADASKDLDFGKLDYGTYSLRAYAYDEDGNKGDVVRVPFEVTEAFAVSGLKTPTVITYGNSYSVKGTISSVHNLKLVKVGVKQDGKWVKYFSYNPAAKTYSLADTAPDMTFKGISPGTYTYNVYLTDVNGHSKTVVKAEFKIAKATFSSSNCTYPTLLMKGEGFGLYGTINSEVPIKTVKVGVCDKDNKWISGFYKSLSGGSKTSFDVNRADEYILFGKLPEGDYIYRIYATDTNGAAKTVLKKSFHVMAPLTFDSSSSSGLTQKQYDAINASDVFLQQEWYRGGCTVTSAGMMMRRALILAGRSRSEWEPITEWNLRANKDIWNGGLYSSFEYLGMTVKQKYFPSGSTSAKKVEILKELLESHPEGIVIYGNYNGQYHATLLTDIKDDILFVVDPVTAAKSPIAESTMYSPAKTQASKLACTNSYWYIVK